MNIDTGEVRRILGDAEMKQATDEGFEPVPNELRDAADLKLAGNDSAMVSLTSGGKLSRWAASRRKKKRQQEKAARRSSRHWGGN